MKQNYDFIDEPTKKALFRMFLPMMIGMLLNFAYNIVDTLWVGNLMGMIPSYIFCHITVMLRCYGDSIFQMLSMLITSILNAVLDPVLINVIGFHGAAAATVFSQIVSLALLILYCRKNNILI